MANLKDKTLEEVAAWLPRMFEEYVADRVKAGEDAASAQKNADAQHAELFPGGQPAPQQFVMNVLVDEEVVGTLWMGRPLNASSDTWFVFDLEIEKGFRGRGFGREAMEEAEEWTREHGGTRVGLNVFGPNLAARSLYDSLGYEVLATAMFKDL